MDNKTKNKLSNITKVVLGLIIIIFLAIGFIYLQTNKKNNSSDIVSIKEKINVIDLVKDYEIRTLNNAQFEDGPMPDGGGQLVGYFKNGNLSKIIEKLGLSHGVKTYVYYLIDDKLIFVHEKDEGFPYTEDSGSFDYTKLESVFDGYYYFKDEVLIHTQFIGEKRFPTSEESNTEIFLLKLVKENIFLLKK